MRIRPKNASCRRAGRLAVVGVGLLGLTMITVVAVTTVTSTVSAAGAWGPTGSMVVGRYNTTSIRLLDGDVLVLGGGIAQPDAVQRYNPSTGTWSTTGSMTASRAYFTATLLADGEVLVVGGENATPLASAELYNPATGTWRSTGSMTTPRLQHTATLLADGEVLVAGGENNGGVPLADAEVYDPAAETWHGTGSMTAPGYDETSVLLHDGTVLVTGGSIGASAGIYNPVTGQWSATGSQVRAYPQATTTLLPDGRVLVAGGISSNGTMYVPSVSTAATELFDPASGAWQAGPNMTLARSDAASVVLGDGSVLVIGGEQVGMTSTIRGMSPVTMTATSEIYNPTTNSWTVGSDTSQARIDHLATVLSDGTVLVAGGLANGPNGLTVLTSAEVYDPSATPPAVPTLTAITPNTATSQGGWVVTLTGTNLSGGHVFFGGSLVAGASCTSTTCSFATTATAPGAYPVTVVTAGGTTPLLIFTVTLAPAPPAVTSVVPSSGAVGTQVTVNGTGLAGGHVSFGVVTADDFTCTATACSGRVPDNGGTVDVIVSTTVGASIMNSADQFTYVAPPAPAPKITKISPTSGPAAGGTKVTITGSNLTAGTVSFASIPATSVTCSAKSCSATSPAGSGTVDVTVSTTGGGSAIVTADRFTYQAPPMPKITKITPATGPATGATIVTITGSNLSAGAVRFGTAAAANVTCTASSCTATSPAGSGTVDVTVTAVGGTSATGTADQFTYQAVGGTANLIPSPGFEAAAIPSDHWGGNLTRSSVVFHSGSWSLAQTTTSSSGGWDLDSDPSWYAPVAAGKTYVASVWVYASKTVKVTLNADLLKSSGSSSKSINGPSVTLAANTWTQLTITGIKPASGQVSVGMEPNFSAASTGTAISWDDMSLTAS
jgi:IPT/TIG domain/Galactose oxidase, central domain